MIDRDMISKAEVLDIYAELYDEFDDAPGIRKVLHRVYDKINNLKEQGKIVRCKDCKHFNDNRCLNDNVHYSIDDCGCQPSFYVTDDWFCAEGERR